MSQPPLQDLPDAKTVTASRSELGLRTDRSWAVNDAILTLRGRAAWAHDFNPDRAIAATFQTLPGASFVVNGAAQAKDAALATASAEMKWRNGFSVGATFEGARYPTGKSLRFIRNRVKPLAQKYFA